MVKISCGCEGRERGWSRVSGRATLVGGHVCRWGWGREAQQCGRKVSKRRSCAERRGVEKCRGGEEGSGSVITTVTAFFFFFFFLYENHMHLFKVERRHPPSPLHTWGLKSQHHEHITTIPNSTPRYGFALGGGRHLP